MPLQADEDSKMLRVQEIKMEKLPGKQCLGAGLVGRVWGRSAEQGVVEESPHQHEPKPPSKQYANLSAGLGKGRSWEGTASVELRSRSTFPSTCRKPAGPKKGLLF